MPFVSLAQARGKHLRLGLAHRLHPHLFVHLQVLRGSLCFLLLLLLLEDSGTLEVSLELAELHRSGVG